MSEDTDSADINDPNGWGENYDIHDYVKGYLEEHVDEDDDRKERHGIQQQAIINYVVAREDIQEYEYHYITAVRIAWNITKAGEEYQQSAEDFIKSREVPDGVSNEKIIDLADSLGRFVIGNNVALTYSMAYELIDDLLKELLPEILREDIREDGGPTLQSQIGSYQSRYQLLLASGVLNDRVAGVVDHVGDVRGDLSHDVERRFDLKTHDDLDIMNEIPIAINTLYEKVYDQPVYELSELHHQEMNE